MQYNKHTTKHAQKPQQITSIDKNKGTTSDITGENQITIQYNTIAINTTHTQKISVSLRINQIIPEEND